MIKRRGFETHLKRFSMNSSCDLLSNSASVFPIDDEKTYPKTTDQNEEVKNEEKPSTSLYSLNSYSSLYFNVFLTAFTLHIWVPLFPYIVKELGGSATE